MRVKKRPRSVHGDHACENRPHPEDGDHACEKNGLATENVIMRVKTDNSLENNLQNSPVVSNSHNRVMSRRFHRPVRSIRSWIRRTKVHQKSKNTILKSVGFADWFVGLSRYFKSRQTHSKNKLVSKTPWHKLSCFLQVMGSWSRLKRNLARNSSEEKLALCL